MRMIRNTLIFLFFLMVGLFVYDYLSIRFNSSALKQAEDLQSLQYKDASIKLAYILDSDKWLTYALQAGEDQVRVMSNAVIKKNYQVLDADRFLYSIIYEVIDDAGKVIRSGEFYHRGGQKVYLDEQTQQQYVSTGIYPPDENPLDSRIHLINLRGLKKITQIRFKSGNYQRPVKQIVLRAYQKKNISDRKLDYAWQRMGEARRQQLAKVSVFDADIISQHEQHQLLKNQWAPLGPLGAADDDYKVQKLYVVRDVENDVVINGVAVPSKGLVIYTGRYGVISLPLNKSINTKQHKTRIKLSWVQFDNNARQNSTDKVTIEWWGHPATRYKKWSRLVSDGELNLDLKNLNGGIVQISSVQPVVVRAWLQTAEQAQNVTDESALEITPKSTYLRLYGAHNLPLEYRVNHIEGYKTPYRFDLRAIDGNPRSKITYHLLDKQERVIESGSISLQQELSPYDAVVAEPQRWITDPTHVYFNLARRVSKVSFGAPPGVWISAYSRPKNLVYTQTAPLSSVLDEKKLHSVMPVWFAVRPQKWKLAMRQGQTQLITVQRKPPQVDSQLLSGLYRWDQFYPDANWKGRNLLNPVEHDLPFREESASSYFVKLNSKHANDLEFIAKPGTQTIRPSLIYVQPEKRSMTIKIWLDGKKYFEDQVHAVNGELQLPYLPSGRYQLRIESFLNSEDSLSAVLQKDNTLFYINNTKLLPISEAQKIMLKRLAIEMTEKSMSFTIFKEKPRELLALRIYTRQPMQKKLTINVKINGLSSRKTGPFNDWTLSQRQYELLPLVEENKSQLQPLILKAGHPAAGRVAGERLFFIPLGSDLPAQQNYTIEVSLQQRGEAYMVMTRSIPGLYPGRQLYPDIEVEPIAVQSVEIEQVNE